MGYSTTKMVTVGAMAAKPAPRAMVAAATMMTDNRGRLERATMSAPAIDPTASADVMNP